MPSGDAFGGFGLTSGGPGPGPGPQSTTAAPSGGEYAFRGPGELDLTGAPGPEVDRVKAAREEAEAKDKALWEKERAAEKAKVDSAQLTQKLQDLVLFQRRCEANLPDVTDRAEAAEREVAALRARVDQMAAAVEQASRGVDSGNARAGSAEAEMQQLTRRMDELRAEQASIASGDGSTSQAALQAELQTMRARVSEAEAALQPHRVDHAALPEILRRVAEAHDGVLRRAQDLGVKPPSPPPSLAATLGAGGGGLPADLPTWGEWADLEDEGFETVQLAWGSWAREHQAKPVPPPAAKPPALASDFAVATPAPAPAPAPQTGGGFGDFGQSPPQGFGGDFNAATPQQQQPAASGDGGWSNF